MAYLDPQAAYNQPQWWTAAVYQKQAGGAYKFLRYTPARHSKWIPFASSLMDAYPLSRGYAVYQFYWDGLAGQWIRQITNKPAISGEAVIGKIERRSPLPIGRYWQDIFEKQSPAWNRWATEHVGSGAVKIVNSQTFNRDPLRDGSLLPDFLKDDKAGTLGIPYRFWVLFDVLRPVPWPQTELGFPEIATPDIQQSSDTAQNPPGPTPLEEVGDAVKGVVVPAVGVLAALLGIKILLELKR